MSAQTTAVPAKCSFEIMLTCGETSGCVNQIQIAIPDQLKMAPPQKMLCLDCSRKLGRLVYMQENFREVPK